MRELIKRLEKEKWHVSGVDIQEAINLIESQAAEIGVLKIAHEAHQTSNLKMLAVLKKQAAEIAELDALRNDAVLRLDKHQALCDQMGDALELMLKSATHYGEAWAKCYVADYETVAIDSKDLRFKLLAICRDKLQAVPEALEAWRAMK